MSPVIAFDIAVVAQNVRVRCRYIMADMLNLKKWGCCCWVSSRSGWLSELVTELTRTRTTSKWPKYLRKTGCLGWSRILKNKSYKYLQIQLSNTYKYNLQILTKNGLPRLEQNWGSCLPAGAQSHWRRTWNRSLLFLWADNLNVDWLQT